MPARLGSSAPSDVGVDISGNLLAGFDGAENRGPESNDEDEDDDEAFITATQAESNRKAAIAKTKTGKGGGFQTMGLSAPLLKAITRKGFTVPTPIQRKTIPVILDGQDCVAMARTGSGKTAAFAIPMIEKLKAHSPKVGARAIIMSPSRELAIQTLKHVKDLGKATDLRSILLVGGDSLEDQFGQMQSNPDIIIATPGRFCHLLVEMSLDLLSVRYMVFDEADRLFEMGFASQLHEILFALPPSRQTLLFSATLPKSLVEFARAGLKDPRLIRLDAETKISPDLQSAFLAVKSAEKEGALLHLLSDVIKIPLAEATTKATDPKSKTGNKKRKREEQVSDQASSGTLDPPTAHSTIVFAATKHHVDYLNNLLSSAGYAVSYVYGSLDQTARKIQVDNFRNGASTILVVTDVAARGIDIPMLANVVNYDFPAQPKVFVHRVGRTARAGRRGWSYSLVQDGDLPYFLDLNLFLGRVIVKGRAGFRESSFAEDMVIGSVPRSGIEPNSEYVSKLLGDDEDLLNQRIVASKGEKLYLRTRNAASAESAKRTKAFHNDPHMRETNPVYGSNSSGQLAAQRDNLLAKISGFKPVETVFEIGKRGITTQVGEALERQRKRMRAKAAEGSKVSAEDDSNGDQTSLASLASRRVATEANGQLVGSLSDEDGSDSASDGEHVGLEDPGVLSHEPWQDSENFMSYQPRETDVVEERGYGVQSGSNFLDAARGATLDLLADDSRSFAEPSKMRWDKRSKKYVARANDEDGSKGAKKITGESGQKIAATFRSGRFDAWRRANRLERMPRTGELEGRSAASAVAGKGSRRFKHFADRAPKRPDQYRDDYHKQKKRYDEAKALGEGGGGAPGGSKSELRGIDDVRKQRLLQQRRRDKNARPSKKRKGM